MGQKRSDLDTIPICRAHHDYQHQVGWVLFSVKYGLDIPELLRALREKPRIEIRKIPYDASELLIGQKFPTFRRNVAVFGGVEFHLADVTKGLTYSLKLLRPLRREHLIDTLFKPLVEARRAG